jgi:hypothetical protein
MFGSDSVLTFAEKMDECKKLSAQFKEDKNLIKLTRLKKNIREVERLILKRAQNNEDLKIKCVVYPKQSNWGKSELSHGLLDKPIKYIRNYRDLNTIEPIYGFVNDDGVKFEIGHDYSKYGPTNKYMNITASSLSQYYDCDLFIEITKEEYKAMLEKAK